MENQDFLRELGNLAVVTRLKRVSDAMLHDGRRMYKELGMDIEPNWFVIFRLLKKYGALGVTYIADRIGLAHPSVITIVNKMMKAGYLTEEKSPGDNRKRMLRLTAKAEEAMPEFERVWAAGTAGVKKMMNDVDVLAFLDTLESRVEEKGFKNRTLEELKNTRAARVIEFDERYAVDFGRLNYEWIAAGYTVEKQDRKILDHPYETIMQPGGQIFFAVVDGVAAGTVALIPMEDENLELTKMAVSPEYRGLGIGDKLMEACVEYGRKTGAGSLILESNTKQIAAINLYRKFGFVEIPLDPNSEYQRANIRMELVLQKPGGRKEELTTK
jgi:ribosomal protein S18 acetylase RimI-like enzyme/predicted transcriptional regulator